MNEKDKPGTLNKPSSDNNPKDNPENTNDSNNTVSTQKNKRTIVFDSKMLEDLMDLIRLGRVEMLRSSIKKHLRNRHFSINTQNEYGNTLLHIACRSRNADIVNMLLNEFNAKTDVKNADGRTPLHIATIYGSTDKTCYISQNGGTKDKIVNSGDIISMIVNKGQHVLLMTDKDGMTPMNYFNIHSDLSSNVVMKSKYKNYKKVSRFFDRLKESGVTKEDYELSLSIYFALKSQQ